MKGPEFEETGTWTWQWACAGDKHLQLDPQGGGESWDGQFDRQRYVNPGAGFSTQNISEYQPALRDDPIDVGYRLEIPLPGSRYGHKVVWISDLLALKETSLAREANGRLAVTYKGFENSYSRTVLLVVDPSRGNMVESRVESLAELHPKARSHSGITTRETHIVAATEIEGHWIPTKILVRTQYASNGHAVKGAPVTLEVGNLSKNVSDAIFGSIFKPGDTVQGTGGPFKVAQDGELVSTVDKPLTPRQSILRAIALALGVTAILVVLGRLLQRNRTQPS